MQDSKKMRRVDPPRMSSGPSDLTSDL